MVENLSGAWYWLRRYYSVMIKAVEKTEADGRERGFLITDNILPAATLVPQVARTRLQTGTGGGIQLKMKPLSPDAANTLISFHTHTGGNDQPSERDEKTAVALGERYTVIGYAENGEPHIKVWRIKYVENEYRTGLIKKL
jgi:hypothetical protein